MLRRGPISSIYLLAETSAFNLHVPKWFTGQERRRVNWPCDRGSAAVVARRYLPAARTEPVAIYSSLHVKVTGARCVHTIAELQRRSSHPLLPGSHCYSRPALSAGDQLGLRCGALMVCGEQTVC